MTFLIAVSGKGGVGKTSVLAMILKNLNEAGETDILVLDGDPDSNMPDVLGFDINGTIADITDRLRIQLEQGNVSPLRQKDRFLDGAIFDIIHESKLFDLLVLGSIEKEGCYCSVNAQLQVILEKYAKAYKYVLLDLPAGLEHINRGVVRAPDILFVVTDGSKMGFSTAKRIKELTVKLQTGEKKLILIGNRVSGEFLGIFEEFARKNGYQFGGLVPEDKELQRLNLLGPSILDIPRDSPAFEAVNTIFSRFVLAAPPMS
ncbi:MAG: ATP-binding protein [Candidatus Hodarchaeales archaeon]|jgi:CO dehydrogenase maturation factor